MAGYDANKAAAFNKLVRSGLSQDAAFIQSGIADADAGNYSLGPNGQLGAVVALGSKANTAPPVDSGLPPPDTAPTAAAAQELLITGQGGQATQNLENIVESQKNIEISQTNIQENQAASLANQQSIVDARAIIALQNTELADEALPDSRRLELEANNAEQLAVIGQAEQNIVFNANNIESSQTNITANQAAIGVNAAGFQAVTGVGIAPPPVAPADDPFEAARLDAQARFETNVTVSPAPSDGTYSQAVPLGADGQPMRQVPMEVDPADDPLEAARLDAETRFNDPPAEFEPADVGAKELGNDYGFTSNETEGADPTQLSTDPAPVETSLDQSLDNQQTAQRDSQLGIPEQTAEEAQNEANFLAGLKGNAKSQGTLQSRYKQPNNGDWRVRLSLAPNSNYLYNAGSAAGVLAPLTATNGVIFPYTPNISTSYNADYEKYNLIHSNYRGLFYKSSSVGDVQIRATFTAQDTREAAYLLAVIHFFRSVTKMFYGQDAQRGTPPPLVYLSGYGGWQFNNHACVVASFNYSLPNEVDYIRTDAPNNFGPNMSNRQTPRSTSPGGINFAGALRLANALIPGGAIPVKPAQNSLFASVNNTNEANYVPTKMEIDITLIPVQTRSQVSKQFSLEGFASGRLLKGGFW
jgi:hypothetical protein